MEFLLRLRHWQLFVLLFGLPVFFYLGAFGLLVFYQEFTLAFAVMGVVLLFAILTQFGWKHALTHFYHRRLHDRSLLDLRWFSFAFYFPLVYMFFFIGFVFYMMTQLQDIAAETSFFWPILCIFPFHALAAACMLYQVYFTAKTIRSAELQREAVFSEYLGQIILLWFAYVGVWILQPKVNKLIEAGGFV